MLATWLLEKVTSHPGWTLPRQTRSRMVQVSSTCDVHAMGQSKHCRRPSRGHQLSPDSHARARAAVEIVILHSGAPRCFSMMTQIRTFRQC